MKRVSSTAMVLQDQMDELKLIINRIDPSNEQTLKSQVIGDIPINLNENYKNTPNFMELSTINEDDNNQINQINNNLDMRQLNEEPIHNLYNSNVLVKNQEDDDNCNLSHNIYRNERSSCGSSPNLICLPETKEQVNEYTGDEQVKTYVSPAGNQLRYGSEMKFSTFCDMYKKKERNGGETNQFNNLRVETRKNARQDTENDLQWCMNEISVNRQKEDVISMECSISPLKSCLSRQKGMQYYNGSMTRQITFAESPISVPYKYDQSRCFATDITYYEDLNSEQPTLRVQNSQNKNESLNLGKNSEESPISPSQILQPNFQKNRESQFKWMYQDNPNSEFVSQDESEDKASHFINIYKQNHLAVDNDVFKEKNIIQDVKQTQVSLFQQMSSPNSISKCALSADQTEGTHQQRSDQNSALYSEKVDLEPENHQQLSQSSKQSDPPNLTKEQDQVVPLAIKKIPLSQLSKQPPCDKVEIETHANEGDNVADKQQNGSQQKEFTSQLTGKIQDMRLSSPKYDTQSMTSINDLVYCLGGMSSAMDIQSPISSNQLNYYVKQPRSIVLDEFNLTSNQDMSMKNIYGGISHQHKSSINITSTGNIPEIDTESVNPPSQPLKNESVYPNKSSFVETKKTSPSCFAEKSTTHIQNNVFLSSQNTKIKTPTKSRDNSAHFIKSANQSINLKRYPENQQKEQEQEHLSLRNISQRHKPQKSSDDIYKQAKHNEKILKKEEIVTVESSKPRPSNNSTICTPSTYYQTLSHTLQFLHSTTNKEIHKRIEKKSFTNSQNPHKPQEKSQKNIESVTQKHIELIVQKHTDSAPQKTISKQLQTNNQIDHSLEQPNPHPQSNNPDKKQSLEPDVTQKKYHPSARNSSPSQTKKNLPLQTKIISPQTRKDSPSQAKINSSPQAKMFSPQTRKGSPSQATRSSPQTKMSSPSSHPQNLMISTPQTLMNSPSQTRKGSPSQGTRSSPSQTILSSPSQTILSSPSAKKNYHPPQITMNSSPKSLKNSSPKALQSSPPQALKSSPPQALKNSPPQTMIFPLSQEQDENDNLHCYLLKQPNKNSFFNQIPSQYNKSINYHSFQSSQGRMNKKYESMYNEGDNLEGKSFQNSEGASQLQNILDQEKRDNTTLANDIKIVQKELGWTNNSKKQQLFHEDLDKIKLKDPVKDRTPTSNSLQLKEPIKDHIPTSNSHNISSVKLQNGNRFEEFKIVPSVDHSSREMNSNTYMNLHKWKIQQSFDNFNALKNPLNESSLLRKSNCFDKKTENIQKMQASFKTIESDQDSKQRSSRNIQKIELFHKQSDLIKEDTAHPFQKSTEVLQKYIQLANKIEIQKNGNRRPSQDKLRCSSNQKVQKQMVNRQGSLCSLQNHSSRQLSQNQSQKQLSSTKEILFVQLWQPLNIPSLQNTPKSRGVTTSNKSPILFSNKKEPLIATRQFKNESAIITTMYS